MSTPHSSAQQGEQKLSPVFQSKSARKAANRAAREEEYNAALEVKMDAAREHRLMYSEVADQLDELGINAANLRDYLAGLE
jgi:hypothetical protein